MVKILLKTAQNWAHKGNTAKVRGLFNDLLEDFGGSKDELEAANDKLIEIFNKLMKAQNDIIKRSTTKRDET